MTLEIRHRFSISFFKLKLPSAMPRAALQSGTLWALSAMEKRKKSPKLEFIGMDYQLLYKLLFPAGLAACAALRPFLTLLVFAIMVQMGQIKIVPHFKFIFHDDYMFYFYLAAALEILIAKLRGVEHFFEPLLYVLRPVTVIFLVVAALPNFELTTAIAYGFAFSLLITMPLYIMKNKGHILSLALKYRNFNYLASLIEDILALLSCVLLYFFPRYAFPVILLTSMITFKEIQRQKSHVMLALASHEHSGGPEQAKTPVRLHKLK